jgi:putative transposase
MDFIPTYKTKELKHEFSGKRIKRGLYLTKNNVLINADINGSINILRKEIGDTWLNSSLSNRGLVVSPIMVIPL